MDFARFNSAHEPEEGVSAAALDQTPDVLEAALVEIQQALVIKRQAEGLRIGKLGTRLIEGVEDRT
jgi:hypothetical protein